MIYGILTLIIIVESYFIMKLNRNIGSIKQDNEVLKTTIRTKNEQLKEMVKPNLDMSGLLNRMHKNEL